MDTHHRVRHHQKGYHKKRYHNKKKIYFSSILFAGLLGVTVSLGMNSSRSQEISEPEEAADVVYIEVGTVEDIQTQTQYSLENLPEYSGEAYVELNGNIPSFTEDEKNITEGFEYYSPLDELGRCGEAYANICDEIRPTEERGSIGNIRPSGWHTVKYNGLIDGNYLYNRCHLIGYQLSGENDNELNLITGTRYLNINGMLPFENMVDDYVDRTGNHVLYRVTPVFEGENLVASGVVMEAWSVEDGGEGICFNVYCYNVQPGVEIDYLTGESRLSGE